MKNKAIIKIEGHLDPKWKDWFEGMEIIHSGENTLLCGTVKDEAFLHGILTRIRDLNLKLISLSPSDEQVTIRKNTES
jgi:hypothetical protein